MVDRMTDDYASNSLTQQQTQNLVSPILIKHLRTFLVNNSKRLSDKGIIKIADLGCADGKNDTGILSQIVEIINEIIPEIHICIYLNDIPSTNATTMTVNVSEVIRNPNVYIFARPQSFYEPIFPDNFIDIFITFTAVHWLPGKPPAPTDGFNITTVHQFTDDESQKKWMDYQEKALQTFYQLRSKELVQGGILFITAPFPWATEEDKEKVLNSDVKLKKLFEMLLKEKGIQGITREICANIMFRKLKDFVDILDSTTNQDLRIIDKDEIAAEQPFYTLFNNKEIDNKKFGKIVGQYRRATCYYPFKQRLIDNGVDETIAEEILTKIFILIEEGASSNTFKFSQTITINYLLLEKN